eukprot:UN00840
MKLTKPLFTSPWQFSLLQVSFWSSVFTYTSKTRFECVWDLDRRAKNTK